MTKKISYGILMAIAVFGFGAIAFALPYYQQTQGLIPDTNDKHYIGTSTPSLLEYNGIFTKNLTVSGTCTGCGGSSYPFTTNTNFGVTVSATSTPIWGIAGLHASSTSHFATSTFYTQNDDGFIVQGEANSHLALFRNTSTGAAHASFCNSSTGCTTSDGVDIGIRSNANGNTLLLRNRENAGLNVFVNNTTEALTIAAGGNVGIGQTVPANKLDVNGSVSLATSGFLGFTGSTAVDATNYSLFGNTTLTLLNARSGGSIGFRIANTDVANFTTTGGFGFGSTYYNIDPGQNNMTVEGRLGVGTSSPGTLLSIGGSGTGWNFVDGTTSTTTAQGNLHVRGNIRTGGALLADSSLTVASLTSGRVPFASTGGLLIDSAAFTFNSAGSLLTATNASTTAATVSSYFSSAGNSGFGSTTPAFRFSVNNAGSDFYIDSNGKVVARDTTNSWSGRLSPTRSFVLSSATTTTWTASTTGSGYTPRMVMPFAGTLRQMRCSTDASFLGVNVQIAGSNVTPTYTVASTTVGSTLFTAGNTFTAGQVVHADFGTTTTSSTKNIACTFDVTETQ